MFSLRKSIFSCKRTLKYRVICAPRVYWHFGKTVDLATLPLCCFIYFTHSISCFIVIRVRFQKVYLWSYIEILPFWYNFVSIVFTITATKRLSDVDAWLSSCLRWRGYDTERRGSRGAWHWKIIALLRVWRMCLAPLTPWHLELVLCVRFHLSLLVLSLSVFLSPSPLSLSPHRSLFPLISLSLPRLLSFFPLLSLSPFSKPFSLYLIIRN